MEEQQFEVVIVGGGPVGMGLAIELGQRGVHCAVVERYLQPQPVPKGQNLTQRTMEHFHFWGVERELRAARTVPADFGIGGLTTYGTLLGDYAYDWLQRELVRPYYFADNERLPQYATEDVLRKRAGELPSVEIFYGWSGVEMTQDANGATAVITDRDGEFKTLRGRYLVGCDGSNSVVREQAGMTQTRLDHDKLMVLLVFRSTTLHTLLERYPGKSFFNVLHPDLKGYWQFFGRVDLGTTWFFHAPVPAGTTQDNFDFKHLLQTAVGVDSAALDVEIEHVGFWDLRIAIADNYQKDRIFIAGDAAHSHPPYGGYGINIGFEDARNLGWKLAAVLKGCGGDGLLASYDEERRPVFASTAHDFIEKSIENDRDFLATYDPARDRKAFEAEWTARGSGATTEVNSFEPHYEGSPTVWGPSGAVSSAKGQHAFPARAGHHLAPQPLTSGNNVFDELGEGMTLLAFDADRETVDAFTDAARALQIPLTVIADNRAEGRGQYEASYILVRPDQFVAWSSADPPENVLDILQKVLGSA